MKWLIKVVLFPCLLACAGPGDEKKSSDKNEKEVTTASGLTYTIMKHGSGEPARAGQQVFIHEKMWYRNDSLLFSSSNLAGPAKVLIGGGQAIEGVDEGLRGMRKGEIRRLIIPTALSRRKGIQTFPHPDSILIYEIELVEIEKANIK